MPPDDLGNIGRIARILRAFGPTNTPKGSAELCAASGASKSTFHGLLRALCAAGWVERQAHGRYRLGPRAIGLALLPHWPAVAPRVSPPKAVVRQPPTAPRPAPRLPSLHPDLLVMQDTAPFRRFGPARIGFANASLANPWRAALLDSVLAQARRHDSRIAGLRVHHAGDDPACQVRQIRQMADEGLDALIISACDDRDHILSAEINRLAAQGLPVLAVDRRPSDMAGVVSFVTASDRTIGAMSALWLAEHLQGRGMIWLLSGRQDALPAMRRLEGARAVLDQFPDLEARHIGFTDWTEAGGYQAAQRCGEAGAAMPAGVWCDSGLHGIGSVRWFLDRHGKAPPHTGGDQNLMYKLCLRHRIPFAAMDYPYSMGAEVLEMTLDVLSGRPVPKRREVPVAMVMPRGCQTKSVVPDIWAETHVGWDAPDDVILPRRRPATPGRPV